MRAISNTTGDRAWQSTYICRSTESRASTTGRSEYRTLSLAKLADLASPVLMQRCSDGKTIAKAKLEFMRADGDGKRVKYYEVELENVLIANMEQMVAEGSTLRDHIALHFSKVKWKYSQQKIGGGNVRVSC